MEDLKFRFKLLFLGLTVAYALFTFSRLIFLLFNYDFFVSNSAIDFLWAFIVGIWFDTVPIFYYNLLFILFLIIPHPRLRNTEFRNLVTILFLFTNGVALFQNLTDVAYFPFNKKRTGAEIFHFTKDWNSSQLFAYATDFWYLIVFFVFALYASYRIINQYKRAEIKKKVRHKNSRVLLWNLLHLSFWVLVTLVGLRGGFGLIPLRTFDAGRYVTTSLVPLTINTPFQLICTIEGNDAPTFHFMSQEEAEQIIHPLKSFKNGIVKKKNVVIIIVESLGKEYMGFYNNGKGYTPFLDSLCNVSLTFENSFANGTTSMDAPPAIFSGIANLMEDSYIVSQFNINTPESIGSILQKEGYNSSFYHGGKNGTMGFDNFISQCGMGNYFGLNEYPNQKDFDGKWGIFDEPYLQYYADELTKRKEPFISSVFTLSSHHPYTVPHKYRGSLPKGKLPIYQSIAYTDMSLKLFFQKARKQAWYANTIFIITADHTSDSDNPKYQTPLGRFAIPFIFFSPENDLPKIASKNIMQQSLLLPTISDYLNLESTIFSLGTSAIDSTNNTFAIFYSGGTYSLTKNNFVLTMTQDGITHFYNRESDPYLQHEIKTSEQKLEMEKLLKAYLQTYIHHLTKNTFVQVN